MKKAFGLKEINHFHITVSKAISGGNPIIKGTRTSVANIAGYFVMGLTPEEIQRELPHLSLAQVFDALTFYLDHRETIDQQREKDKEKLVAKEFPPGEGGNSWQQRS